MANVLLRLADRQQTILHLLVGLENVAVPAIAVPPASQQDTACTSFTGELQNLIRSGIPGKPGQLTFNDIYPELLQRLKAAALINISPTTPWTSRPAMLKPPGSP